MSRQACGTRIPHRRCTGVPLLLAAAVLSLSFSFVAGLSGVGGPRSLRSPQIQGAQASPVCAKDRLVLRQRGGGEDADVEALLEGGGAEQRTVQFQVEVPTNQSKPGLVGVRVVGNCSELGDWQIEKALVLMDDGSGVWKADLSLPVGSKMLFKLVVVEQTEKETVDSWEVLAGNRVAAVVPGGVEPLVVHAVFGQEVSPGHEALSPQLAPPLPLEQPGGQSAASAGIVRRVLATPQSRSRSPTATMDNFLAYLRKCKQWAPVLVFFTVVILRKLFYAYFSRPPPIAPPITPPVVPPIVPLNVSPVDGGDAAKQIVEDFTPQEILRALLDESGGGDVADVDTESWRVYRPFQVLSGLVAVGTAAISTLRL